MENTGYVYIGIKAKGTLKGRMSEEFAYVCYQENNKPNDDFKVIRSAFCFSPEKIVECVNGMDLTNSSSKFIEDIITDNKALDNFTIQSFSDLCKFSNLANLTTKNSKSCYYLLKTNGQQMWRWSFRTKGLDVTDVKYW